MISRIFYFLFFSFLSAFTPLAVSADTLNVHVLDVGEGQSVLLHSNNRAILVDTGHAGMVEMVLKRMETLGIKNVDYLFLTHLHADHASGYFRVMEQFPQLMTFDGCFPVKAGRESDMERWVDSALIQNPNRRCVAQGDKIEWQGTEIEVLWPSPEAVSEKGLNHNSLVLHIHHGQRSMLIMGDVDKEAEILIMKQKQLQPVEILVVGHHGAADASSVAFLQTVRPKTAVISVNRDNFRGYPDRKTLDRINQNSGLLHITSESGEYHAVME